MPAHKHSTEAITHEDEPLFYVLTSIQDRLAELENREVRDLQDEVSRLKSRLAEMEIQAKVTLDLLKMVVATTDGIKIESDEGGKLTVEMQPDHPLAPILFQDSKDEVSE